MDHELNTKRQIHLTDDLGFAEDVYEEGMKYPEFKISFTNLMNEIFNGYGYDLYEEDVLKDMYFILSQTICYHVVDKSEQASKPIIPRFTKGIKKKLLEGDLHIATFNTMDNAVTFITTIPNLPEYINTDL